MIAMQYSFILPADYDMDIIDRRIRDKGALTDDFPHLTFKAYLTARKGDRETGARRNAYAPFYVWENGEGFNSFVCGPGFAGVSDAFGRPQVATWMILRTALSAEIRNARFATVESAAIGTSVSLSDLRQRESDATEADIESGGALASVSAFEPTRWTQVRFRLWHDVPKTPSWSEAETYRLGHLSLPGETGATA